MKNKNLINRRSFLKGASALAAFTIVPRHVLGGPGYLAPSEQLTKAVVGVGGMGQGHLNYPGAKLLAICDVDRVRRDEGKRQADQTQSTHAEYEACAAYNDYRDVLARDDIDAVVVVTPDHWHTPISLHAVQAGKDVYCEKPISITIGQGRQLGKPSRFCL